MSRDEAYLLDMLIAARRANEVVKELTYDRFKTDWKQSSAVIHQLTILGEVDLHQVWIIATKELPPLIEFLETVTPSN